MTNSKNKTPAPERLTERDLTVRPPLELEWLGSEVELRRGKKADARIRLTRRGESQTFLVEYKKLWTGAALKRAIEQARALVEYSPDDLPMVVLPYLSREMLETLLREGVSGLDLVGNGYVDTPNWGMWLEGQANTFKNTQVIKSPYQGKSALVARTLLSMPILPNAEALRAEIEKRGGSVSQPVVSRALKAFRDDLIVGKQGEFDIVLLQPEKLLDRLAEQWKVTVERWQKSGQTVLWRGQVQGDRNEYLQEIFRNARETKATIMFTGLDAVVMEMNIATEPTRYIYASRTEKLLENLEAQQTRRFPNLEILTPPDEAVFFDSRWLTGLRWPSQLQSYLELITDDVRLQQGAEELRKVILELVADQKSALLKPKDAA